MALPQDHDSDLPSTREGHSGPPKFVSRPVQRPTVDPAAAQEFGRPPGVLGAFADQPVGPRREWTAAPPPPEMLAAAFGRPSGSVERLQRPPGRSGAGPAGGPERQDAFWPQGAGHDPWSDPWAVAALGAPAVAQRPAVADDLRPGARLSLADVLFGRRLSRRALALLGAVVLVIGGVGGLVGRLTAEGGALLNDPGFTLSTASTILAACGSITGQPMADSETMAIFRAAMFCWYVRERSPVTITSKPSFSAASSNWPFFRPAHPRYAAEKVSW